MSRLIDLDIYDKDIKLPKSVIALGNFDGMHIGHRNILNKTIEIAKEKKIKSSVLIFKQHTNEIFTKFSRHYISSFEDKIEILRQIGIDIIYTLNFTKEFAKLSNEEFMLNFVKNKINASTIICGKDYSFGFKSKGNVGDILNYKKNKLIDCHIIDFILENNKKLSSTTIREDIRLGNVDKVIDLLNRYYTIRGKIIHGYKIGRKELGFPTANIQLEFNYVLPEEAVYLTYIIIDGEKYLSLTSIGTNPTVTDNTDIKIETYILDFDKLIYGKNIKLQFILKIRKQVKFDSKYDLIKQLNKDLTFAIKYKKNCNN